MLMPINIQGSLVGMWNGRYGVFIDGTDTVSAWVGFSSHLKKMGGFFIFLRDGQTRGRQVLHHDDELHSSRISDFDSPGLGDVEDGVDAECSRRSSQRYLMPSC